MKLSRHVKNNMRLYEIEMEDIMKVVESPDVTGKEGDRTIAVRKIPGRYSGHPLKVVYVGTDEELFVITAYPLRKKHWG